MLNSFKPSGKALPCPVCGRTKDGDCRLLSDGRVFCHTEQHGTKGKKCESNEIYIYLGRSEEAQGAGMWKLDEAPLCKAPREYGIRYFDYFFWDGAAVPAQRYRKDADGQPKEVKWAKGGLAGRSQSEVAPYLWEKAAGAKQLFVVRGELKAELLCGKGFTAISCLNQKDETLAAKLQAMIAGGVEIVLTPDCDTADLDKWFHFLSSEVPGVKQLLAPGLPWAKPPADGGLGIEDWIYAKNPSNDEILAAITSMGESGLSSNEKNLVALEEKIKTLVDKYEDPLKRSAIVKKEASELGFSLTVAELTGFIAQAEYKAPTPYTHLNPQPFMEEPKLWGNLFLYRATNLIIAPPKVGKSALAVHLFACMLRGESHCLGEPIHNRCKTLIIIGGDMGISQWHKLLIREGLATVVDGVVHIVPEVILYPKGKKVQLDSQGRNTIKELAVNNPNAMILIDTLRSQTASLGLAEGTREAAIPVELLFESLAEITFRPPTVVVAHHSKLSGGSNAANSSAGGYAIPSAFDQTINMSWLKPNTIGPQLDKRILLHSSGRGSQDQSICIELAGVSPNPVKWIGHGNAEDLMKAEAIKAVEDYLEKHPLKEKVYDHVQAFYQANGRGVESKPIKELFQIGQQKADRVLRTLCELGLIFKTHGHTASAGDRGGRPAAFYYPHYAERTEEGGSSSSSSRGGFTAFQQKPQPSPPLETDFSTGSENLPDPLQTGVSPVSPVSPLPIIAPDPLLPEVSPVSPPLFLTSFSSSSSSFKEEPPKGHSYLAGSSLNACALNANDSENDTETLKPQLEQAVQVFRNGVWEGGWTISDSRNPHSLRIRIERNGSVFQLANQRWGIDIRPEVSTSPEKEGLGVAALDTSPEVLEPPSSGVGMPVTDEQGDSFF